MSKPSIKLIVLVIIAAAALVLVGIVIGKQVEAPSEQNTSADVQPNEQKSNVEEGDTNVQPDINTQEFKLTSSNVSCSTTTVNGVTSKSCSGNIRVIPRAQADMEPGLYKINEQTKLLHEGVEQDLNSLQQLSQNQTVVTLKLSDGSVDTLAEIRY